jgi:hypothetical protein
MSALTDDGCSPPRQVLDAATKRPVVGAVATVSYGGGSEVTRKLTSAAGGFSFGGWAGRAAPTPHTVYITAGGYDAASALVQLVGKRRTPLEVHLTPSSA